MSHPHCLMGLFAPLFLHMSLSHCIMGLFATLFLHMSCSCYLEDFSRHFSYICPTPSYSWKPGFDNHTYSLFLILLYTLSIYYQSSYILWSIYLYCCPNHIEKTLLIFTKNMNPYLCEAQQKDFFAKPIQFLIAPYIYPFCPQILRQTVFLRIHPTDIHLITSYSVTSVFNICSSIPIDIFPWSQFVTAYFRPAHPCRWKYKQELHPAILLFFHVLFRF